MEQSIWEHLSVYGSVDVVKQAYFRKHHRQLSAQKAIEITSHILQGRDYFEGVNHASQLTKPLLLYYGVLAFTRAVILFNDPRARETSLSSSHGLQIVGWQNTLSLGLKYLPDLQVRFCRGSFSEFAFVTSNNQNVRAITLLGNRREEDLIAVAGTRDVSTATLTLKDILERLPDLIEIYHRIYEELPRSYLCRAVFVTPPGALEINLRDFSGRAPTTQELKRHLALPDDARFSVFDKGENLYLHIDRLSRDDMVDSFPYVVSSGSKTFLLAPFSGGLKLSYFSLLFVASYMIGMMVRYFPTVWASLSRGINGDMVFPLLEASVNAVQRQFPVTLLEEFER